MGVPVGVSVTVRVGAFVGVRVTVFVVVGDWVGVGVAVLVFVGVLVAVGLGVAVAVKVAHRPAVPSQAAPITREHAPQPLEDGGPQTGGAPWHWQQASLSGVGVGVRVELGVAVRVAVSVGVLVAVGVAVCVAQAPVAPLQLAPYTVWQAPHVPPAGAPHTNKPLLH